MLRELKCRSERFLRTISVIVALTLLVGVGVIGTLPESALGKTPTPHAELTPTAQAGGVPIGPGVQYFPPETDSGKGVHVVRLPLEHEYIRLQASLARDQAVGLEPVLMQALLQHKPQHAPDENVIVAINADFFATASLSGLPVGLHVQNGEIVTNPADRPAFGIGRDGKLVIGEPTLRAFVWLLGATGPAKLGVGEALRHAEAGNEAHLTAAIDTINRPQRGAVSLYTSRFGAETPPLSGTVVVARGMVKPGQPGIMHTGIVSTVTTFPADAPGKVNIPPDGIIFASAPSADTVLDGLQVGDWLNFAFELAPPFTGVSEAVAGWPILVQNGQVQPLSTRDPLVTRRHPRTAIGYNDEEIFVVIVDGRHPGHADGMTLPELADKFISLGATDAINLDGGGSSTLVLRPVGEAKPAVANAPSDGTERGVANALLVVSTAPKGQLHSLHIRPAAPALLRGAIMPITVGGLDVHNNPVPIVAEDIVWEWDSVVHRDGSTAPGAGAIWVPLEEDDGDEDNGHVLNFMFTSSTPGNHTAKLKATVDAVEGTTEIDIVDEVVTLRPAAEEVNIPSGETKVLTVHAFDEGGRRVWLDAHQIDWTAGEHKPAQGAGGVDETTSVVNVSTLGWVTGRLPGEAEVYARRGDALATTKVVIDELPTILADFSDADLLSHWRVHGVRAEVQADRATAPQGLRSGRASVRFDYDLGVNPGGTAAAYLEPPVPIPVPGRPEAIGVWVYGTNNGHWLRGNYIDGNGKQHVLDFTVVGGLNWDGWRFVSAPIPSDTAMPVSLERIYVVEMHRERQTAGRLYLDRIVALYEDD